MEATVRQKILAAALTAVLWLLAIVAMHFYPDVKQELAGFALVCQSVILLLTGAHMGASATASTTASIGNMSLTRTGPGSQQTGFIAWSWMYVILPLAFGTALLTTACTTTTASMYSGLYTQAKAGVQVFDDNSLKTMKDILCAQPYSSIQRHPEYQAGFVILCGPLTNTASLSAEQLAMLATLYKQMGLQPAAVALPPAK